MITLKIFNWIQIESNQTIDFDNNLLSSDDGIHSVIQFCLFYFLFFPSDKLSIRISILWLNFSKKNKINKSNQYKVKCHFR